MSTGEIVLTIFVVAILIFAFSGFGAIVAILT